MINHCSGPKESDRRKESVSNDSWPRQHKRISVSREWLCEFLCQNGISESVVRIETLGGLVNSNYRVLTDSGENYFLRIASRDDHRVAKENFLLRKLAGHIPLPATLATGCYRKHPVVLQTWCEGVTLKHIAGQLTENESLILGSDIGQVLARLHSFPSSISGFLGDSDEVQNPFEMTPVVFFDYIEQAVNLCRNQIGRQLAYRAMEFTRRHAHLLDHISKSYCVCHGDFHPNNLIVNRIESMWRLVGVVDWESAFIWTPLLDIAHMFRRPMPNDSAMHAGVIAGYETVTQRPINNWPALCGLFQMLSWVDKLASGETRDAVANSAKEGINRIVSTNDCEERP